MTHCETLEQRQLLTAQVPVTFEADPLIPPNLDDGDPAEGIIYNLHAQQLSSSSLRLWWSEGSEFSAYRIYRSHHHDGPFTPVVDTDTEQYNAVVSGLLPFTEYTFRVSCYDPAFGDQGHSQVVDVRTLAKEDLRPNDSIDDADWLGSLSGPRVFRNFVGDYDPADWYRIRLMREGSLRLDASELGGEVVVTLHRDNRDGTTTLIRTLTIDEDLVHREENLASGCYFVSLQRTGSVQTNYRLAMTPNYAGNSLAAARPVAVSRSTTSLFDTVGPADSADYYTFDVSGLATVTFRLRSLTQNADAELLDSDGHRITICDNAGISDETLTRTLWTGTYYVRVIPGADAPATRYRLDVGML